MYIMSSAPPPVVYAWFWLRFTSALDVHYMHVCMQSNIRWSAYIDLGKRLGANRTVHLGWFRNTGWCQPTLVFSSPGPESEPKFGTGTWAHIWDRFKFKKMGPPFFAKAGPLTSPKNGTAKEGPTEPKASLPTVG